MAKEDEVDLFRRLAPRNLDLWPEYIEPHAAPVKVNAESALALEGDSFYLAVGEVLTYPIKRGREKGMMKIDEILSPVVHLQRSVIDEDGQLRSGHLWAETEAKGDLARTGGKAPEFNRL